MSKLLVFYLQLSPFDSYPFLLRKLTFLACSSVCLNFFLSCLMSSSAQPKSTSPRPITPLSGMAVPPYALALDDPQ